MRASWGPICLVWCCQRKSCSTPCSAALVRCLAPSSASSPSKSQAFGSPIAFLRSGQLFSGCCCCSSPCFGPPGCSALWCPSKSGSAASVVILFRLATPMQERMMPLLEVRGLSKVFGRLVALSAVDLIVGENEFRGLIGPNGSGKSTLLKCVAGAELPTEGTIRFDGRDVTMDTPTERSRAGIGLKFQITSVLPALTVYDNLLLAMQARSSTASLIFSRTRGPLYE